MVCDDRSGGPVLDVGWWGWRRGIAILLNRFEPVDQRVRRGQTLMLTLKKLVGKSEFISAADLFLSLAPTYSPFTCFTLL